MLRSRALGAASRSMRATRRLILREGACPRPSRRSLRSLLRTRAGSRTTRLPRIRRPALSRRLWRSLGVNRHAQPRRGGQLEELRIKRRTRGHLIDARPAAVVHLHELDRIPTRDARPAEDPALAIAERGEVCDLDSGFLRFSREHYPHDVPQPCPTLRRRARAALIGVAGAPPRPLAGFITAKAGQAQSRVSCMQDGRETFVCRIFFATRRSLFSTHVNSSSFPRRVFCARVLFFASLTRISGWRSAERRTGACEAPVGPALSGQARHLARRLASPYGGRPPPGALTVAIFGSGAALLSPEPASTFASAGSARLQRSSSRPGRSARRAAFLRLPR
jgi:hypothetical protein